PDSTFREAFLWLKREQEIVSQEDWLMGPIQQHTISSIAVEEGASAGDEYGDWLRQAGYPHLVPVKSGLLATTQYHPFYGDDFQWVSAEKLKNLIKRKYWKYFTYSEK